MRGVPPQHGGAASRLVVAGVDPGLARTGYGVIATVGDQVSVLEAGIIVTGPQQPEPDRLLRLYDRLVGVFWRHRPSVVAVERLFFNRNARSALAVGQARGVVMLAASQVGARVVEFSPQQVKLEVSGWGAGDKAQVVYMVRHLLALERELSPDEADALALALCGARQMAVGAP